MTRIAFVIIATQAQPWSAIHTAGQVPTWLGGLSAAETYFCAYSSGTAGESWISKTDHRKIEYARAANKRVMIRQPTLDSPQHGVFEAVNSYGSLVTCTLSAMSHLIQSFQPDYIVRTNVSSYWNLDRLRNLLSAAPARNYYAGLPHRLYGGLYGRLNRAGYAAGAGFVVSADVAAKFVQHYKTFSTAFIDDMAFGLQAKRLRLKLTPLNRLDLQSFSAAQACSLEKLSAHYHVRCKSYLNPRDESQRDDVKIMHSIHARLTGAAPGTGSTAAAPWSHPSP